jgi:hypothetical protein
MVLLDPAVGSADSPIDELAAPITGQRDFPQGSSVSAGGPRVGAGFPGTETWEELDFVAL